MLCALSVLLLSFTSGFGERRLACSSETGELWYTCNGSGLYYLTFNMEPCLKNKAKGFTLNFTVIPMKKLENINLKIDMWHENQMVRNFLGSYFLGSFCKDKETPDSQVCELIKGESLTDSHYFTTKLYILPKGRYNLTVALSDGTGHEIYSCECTGTIK
ncbi:hypothetical protein AGOR_G00043180 [Albula goreensis]|uniref:Lymphocyte antigen 96 n=1 Tax=Albula goreensis TaxID=1534307 RepID=A0A8T3E608_9TELE|nr:hypothetical protein AGOR_G00043180 [Albula goreensis]